MWGEPDPLDPQQELALALLEVATHRRDTTVTWCYSPEGGWYSIGYSGRWPEYRLAQVEVVELVAMAIDLGVPRHMCAEVTKLSRARIAQIAVTDRKYLRQGARQVKKRYG